MESLKFLALFLCPYRLSLVYPVESYPSPNLDTMENSIAVCQTVWPYVKFPKNWVAVPHPIEVVREMVGCKNRAYPLDVSKLKLVVVGQMYVGSPEKFGSA